jgi:hypothetical protein
MVGLIVTLRHEVKVTELEVIAGLKHPQTPQIRQLSSLGSG